MAAAFSSNASSPIFPAIFSFATCLKAQGQGLRVHRVILFQLVPTSERFYLNNILANLNLIFHPALGVLLKICGT